MRLSPKLHKELRDQGAHAGAAFLVVAIATLLGVEVSLVGSIWLGFALGLVRELTEEGEISLEALKSALGSELDLAFWTLGGAIGGLLL